MQPEHDEPMVAAAKLGFSLEFSAEGKVWVHLGDTAVAKVELCPWRPNVGVTYYAFTYDACGGVIETNHFLPTLGAAIAWALAQANAARDWINDET